MNSNLINYNGIDNLNEYEGKWNYPYKLEGLIDSDDEIKNILSFSIDKECVSYKVINIFQNSNLDEEDFFGNLVVINKKFSLNFEYGNHESFSKLNIISKTIYDSSFKSISELKSLDIDVVILVKDLFCTNLDNYKIYYCINLMVYINEL